jgi:hypothetical protein
MYIYVHMYSVEITIHYVHSYNNFNVFVKDVMLMVIFIEIKEKQCSVILYIKGLFTRNNPIGSHHSN